eukprot:15271615-Alexandrium_andersonii.AAC.1
MCIRYSAFAEQVSVAAVHLPGPPASRQLHPGLHGVLEEVVTGVDPLTALHRPEDVVAHRSHLSAMVPAPLHGQVALLVQEAEEDRLGH